MNSVVYYGEGIIRWVCHYNGRVTFKSFVDCKVESNIRSYTLQEVWQGAWLTSGGECMRILPPELAGVHDITSHLGLRPLPLG